VKQQDNNYLKFYYTNFQLFFKIKLHNYIVAVSQHKLKGEMHCFSIQARL